jgi:hypothetical protein
MGPDPKSPAMTRKDDEREKRLAEALRENLRRRKTQARGDAGDDQADEQKDDCPPARSA